MKSFESLYLLILWTLIGVTIGEENATLFRISSPYDICKNQSGWDSIELLPENGESNASNSVNYLSINPPDSRNSRKEISQYPFCNNSTIPLRRSKRDTCNFLAGMAIRSAISMGRNVLKNSDPFKVGNLKRGRITLNNGVIRGLSSAYNVREDHLMCYGNTTIVTIVMAFPRLDIHFTWIMDFLVTKGSKDVTVKVIEMEIYLLVAIKQEGSITQSTATVLDAEVVRLDDLKVELDHPDAFKDFFIDVINALKNWCNHEIKMLIANILKKEINNKLNFNSPKNSTTRKKGKKKETADKAIKAKAELIVQREMEDIDYEKKKLERLLNRQNQLNVPAITDEYDEEWKKSVVKKLLSKRKSNENFGGLRNFFRIGR